MTSPEMTSPDFKIPNTHGPEQKGAQVASTERVLSRLGGAAQTLLNKLKDAFSIPPDAGVAMGKYRETTTPRPRTIDEIKAYADRVDPSGWAHGTTSGNLPKLTDEMIARGDAATAAGENVTDAVNDTDR